MVTATIVDAKRYPADVRAGLPLNDQPFESPRRAGSERGRSRANLALELLNGDARNILKFAQVRLLEHAPKITSIARVDRRQIEPRRANCPHCHDAFARTQESSRYRICRARPSISG